MGISSKQLINITGWATAIAGPILLTLVLNAAGGPKLRDYAFLYVGTVAVIAVTFGLGPSLLAALASFLLVDYYFVPPYYTFTIAAEQDIVNLLVLFGAAGLVGALGSMRRSAQLRAQRLADQLGEANVELARLNREQAEAAAVALRLARTEEQVKALEQSDRSRREFLANVSHDLRTPIATVLTASTALLEDRALSPSLRGSLESVAQEARRLNALVTDMLDMARIEGDALDLQLEAVDVRLAVEAAADRLRQHSADRLIEIAITERVMVLADWSRLGRVLDNLLSNADRAAPQGASITVRAEADGNVATIRVSDPGPGIPAELGARAFERFVHGDGGGTGLGLAIVKGIVEAQAGSVWIDTGPGATIAFELPLAG